MPLSRQSYAIICEMQFIPGVEKMVTESRSIYSG